MADDVSDIELLVAAAGLTRTDTWGELETMWRYRAYAEEQIASPTQATGDAIVNAVRLKTRGPLAEWQRQLASVPEEVARARIEEAAQRWGGYTPAGLLTVARPGDTLTRVEWMVDAAQRTLAIVYAVNRVWQPTTKRLAARTAALAVKPDRFAERIEAAFTEGDPKTALRLLTEVQLDAVRLAPSGPYVDRACVWLAEALEILQ